MTVRELSVPGAWEITPRLHRDSRGLFFEWFTDPGFAAFAGHRFDLRQANCSVSSVEWSLMTMISRSIAARRNCSSRWRSVETIWPASL